MRKGEKRTSTLGEVCAWSAQRSRLPRISCVCASAFYKRSRIWVRSKNGRSERVRAGSHRKYDGTKCIPFIHTPCCVYASHCQDEVNTSTAFYARNDGASAEG